MVEWTPARIKGPNICDWNKYFILKDFNFEIKWDSHLMAADVYYHKIQQATIQEIDMSAIDWIWAQMTSIESSFSVEIISPAVVLKNI